MGERLDSLLRDLLPVATALLGVWFGSMMNIRGIERSVPLQFRTEQVVSAYAQYIATASGPTMTSDTSARLREAKAIISAYGSAEVVDALADVQTAVDALQAATNVARAQAVASAIAAVTTSETLARLNEARIIISTNAGVEVAGALERVRTVVIAALDLASTQAEAERSRDAADTSVSDALVAAVSEMVTGDTYAYFRQARAIISAAGHIDVVDTLNRLDAAISTAVQTPHVPESAQPGGSLDTAVNEAIVSAIAAMRTHVGEEPVPPAHLAQIFGVP